MLFWSPSECKFDDLGGLDFVSEEDGLLLELLLLQFQCLLSSDRKSVV